MGWFDGFASHSYSRQSLVYGDLGANQGLIVDSAYPVVGNYLSGALLIFNSLFGYGHFRSRGFPSEPVNSGVLNWGMWCAPQHTLAGAWSANTPFAQLNYIDELGDRYRSLALIVTPTLQLEIYVGQTTSSPFSGTLIYQSDPDFFEFSPSTESYIHLELRINAPGNTMQIYRNQVLHETITDTVLYVLAPTYNEVVVNELQSFGFQGMAISDSYIVDPAVYGVVGYGRVTTNMIAPYSTADVEVTGWTKTWLYGTAQELPAIGGVLRCRNVAPWSTVYPDISGNGYVQGDGLLIFGFDRCFPVGEIHALSLRVTVQRIAGSLTEMRGVVRNGPGNYEYSDYQTVAAGDYQTLNFLFRLDPFTGLAWSEADFTSIGQPYQFGIEATDTVRITQIVVMRLHTSLNDPGPRYFADNHAIG